MAKTKRYFLVKETTMFVDPHGSPDSGDTEKYISNDPEMLNKHKKYYNYDEEVEEEDLEGSEDGYNATYEYYEVKEISKEKADKAKEIIKAYEKL